MVALVNDTTSEADASIVIDLLAHSYLEQVYLMRGEAAPARMHLSTAVKIDPTFRPAQEALNVLEP